MNAIVRVGSTQTTVNDANSLPPVKPPASEITFDMQPSATPCATQPTVQNAPERAKRGRKPGGKNRQKDVGNCSPPILGDGVDGEADGSKSKIHWNSLEQMLVAQEVLCLCHENQCKDDLRTYRDAMRKVLPEAKWRPWDNLSNAKGSMKPVLILLREYSQVFGIENYVQAVRNIQQNKLDPIDIKVQKWESPEPDVGRDAPPAERPNEEGTGSIENSGDEAAWSDVGVEDAEPPKDDAEDGSAWPDIGGKTDDAFAEKLKQAKALNANASLCQVLIVGLHSDAQQKLHSMFGEDLELVFIARTCSAKELRARATNADAAIVVNASPDDRRNLVGFNNVIYARNEPKRLVETLDALR